MAYRDPKTKVLYPSKEWMFEHRKTLPEVQKAYPDYKIEVPVEPTVPIKPEVKEKPITPPKVGNSKVDAGKDYIQVRTEAGLSSDITTLKGLYRERGFEDKYGTWVGSATQYRAMTQFEEIERKVGEAKKKVEEIEPQVDILARAKKAGMEITGKTTIETAAKYLGEELPSEEEPISAGEELTDADFATILDEFTTGKITTPELELSKEEKEELDKLEGARYQSALASTQQKLASRGMAFSGIRTTAEENLAAEHMASMAGISRNLAAKIIAAARAEAQRRQPNYRIVGGDLYEIVPGQAPRKIIDVPATAQSYTYKGSIFERDPETGEWRLVFTAPGAGEGEGVGWMDFTDQEKRKLANAGLDWTTPQGYQAALDYLYTTIDDSDRISKMDAFFSEKQIEEYPPEKEMSGFNIVPLTAQDYQQGLKLWISIKGSRSDFLSVYPPEDLLTYDEISKLPSSVLSTGFGNLLEDIENKDLMDTLKGLTMSEFETNFNGDTDQLFQALSLEFLNLSRSQVNSAIDWWESVNY